MIPYSASFSNLISVGVERGTVGISVPVLLWLCSILHASSDFLLVGGRSILM